MKLIFSALHFANLRIFESAVRELARRGHEVRLVADEPETFGGQALVERLSQECPGVSWGWVPSVRHESWFALAQKVRFALDYVRFLDTRYADAPKLRLRNIVRTPRIVRWMTSGPAVATGAHRLVRRTLQWMERRLPPSEAVRAWLETDRPDAVILASLTVSRSSAMDQLKAARALGVPVVAAIQSWDHLSSKAPLHIAPDLTLVWNDVQRQEAVEMHHLRPERVVVTGAQCYDQWFGRQPSRSREAFCRDVGLDPTRPFVLYVCSAMSPAPTPLEPHFVRDWVAALRASDDVLLRDAGILVRPHPERVREWDDVPIAEVEQVVIHGRTPIDADAKADYYDSLHHAAAVVGLCTSAFIEAAIVGKPVLTLLLPQYRMHQDGMAHFRYLQTVGGGLLLTAPDLPAHLAQLAPALRQTGADDRARRFVQAFVRPYGLDQPSTPRFADAVEGLRAQAPLGIAPETVWSGLGTRLVERLALVTREGTGAWLMRDMHDDERSDRHRQTATTRQQRQEERTARRAAEQHARQEVIRRTAEERRGKAEARTARVRTKQAHRESVERAKNRQDARKRRAHWWRQWRYRLGTLRRGGSRA